MKSFIKFIIIAALGFLLGGEVAALQGHSGFASRLNKFAGVSIVKSTPDPESKAHIGGPFSLVDQTGKKVTEKSWPGKYKLVYFGFTHCADTCPETLHKIVGVLQRLAPAQADKIVPIFMTVDPGRDTAAQMAAYLPQFHSKRLAGLTGTAAEVEAAEKAYHVYVATKPAESADDRAEQLEAHSAYMYLMSPQDNLVQVFDSDESAGDLQQKLHEYVK